MLRDDREMVRTHNDDQYDIARMLTHHIVMHVHVSLIVCMY